MKMSIAFSPCKRNVVKAMNTGRMTPHQFPVILKLLYDKQHKFLLAAKLQTKYIKENLDLLYDDFRA